MNQLYEAAQASLSGLSEFADIERVAIVRPPNLERELEDALARCRLGRQDAQTLACMVIAESHGALPERELRSFADLSMNFGLYERVISCCKRLRLIHANESEQFNLRMLEAKALRGLGKYEQAQLAYRDLLKDSRDELSRTGLLLNLAKVAHTSEWRLGYYYEMINTLIDRLRRLLAGTPSTDTIGRLRYWLGVCLDSSAKVALETALIAHVVDTEQARRSFDMLKEAITISSDDGQQGSFQRRRLHQCYFQFRLASSSTDRLRLVREFGTTLEELGDKNDPRGLGVRYGQLMEMQTQVGLLDKAQVSCAYALRYARLVSDWRALARNQLRAARLTLAQEQPHTEAEQEAVFKKFRQQIRLASDSIRRLGQQHPEIEIEVERELSLQLQARRDLEGSHAALQRITTILDRQEQRVLADFAEHSRPASEFCPAERNFLTPAEWNRLTAALVVDYRMLSRQLRATLEQTNRLATWSAREQGVKTHLWFLRNYMSSVEHRSKNVMNLLQKDQVLGVLKRFAAESGRESVQTAVGTLERQLDEIDALRKQAEHDLNIIHKSERQFVSMRRVAASLDLGFERNLDPGLKLSLPASNELDDFFLFAHEPLLKQVVTHLVENAGRAVRERPTLPHEINVRVTARVDPDGSRWGRLEVEDTGNGAQALRSALQRIAGKRHAEADTLPVSGLFLAYQCFQTFYARFDVKELDGGRTVLQVDFPHDNVHVLVGMSDDSLV